MSLFTVQTVQKYRKTAGNALRALFHFRKKEKKKKYIYIYIYIYI